MVVSMCCQGRCDINLQKPINEGHVSGKEEDYGRTEEHLERSHQPVQKDRAIGLWCHRVVDRPKLWAV